MMLGDLGATVIKVERPGAGDDTRAWGPPWHGDGEHRASTYFLGVNRNKRSVLLELGDEEDNRLARRLADRADILVENFTPGTLDRFGLGPADCAHRNERLIYCTIEGFGDTPAAAALPGYDLLGQATSGLMSITGEPDGRPLKVGVALVDVLAALNATIGVLAAVEQRHRTGKGDRVQVSLFDAAMSALINQASGYLLAESVPGRVGNAHPSIAPYSTFPAADRSFVLACGNDAQFARVCEEIGQPELATDERFATNTARVANRRELEDLLAQAFRDASALEWIDRMTARKVPACAVNRIDEAFTLAEDLDLNSVLTTVTEDGREIPTVRSPLRFSGSPLGRNEAPPGLGQHDTEIREWLAAEEESTSVSARETGSARSGDGPPSI
jgi:crotonobetainyl-CoA:carnitine CoA-transferase CaiB-like acyl-CoA transferase